MQPHTEYTCKVSPRCESLYEYAKVPDFCEWRQHHTEYICKVSLQYESSYA